MEYYKINCNVYRWNYTIGRDNILKQLLGFGNTYIHYVYSNGFIENTNMVKERDMELKSPGRAIIKKSLHAYIDSRGRKHYFVNGTENQTSRLYENIEERNPEIQREAIHATLRTNLLRNIANAQSLATMTILLILVAGCGVGYILGTEYGGDNYNQQEYSNNYYTQEKETNETVILVFMDLDIINRGVEIWENLKIL